jgi:hypothetical protein
MSRPIIKIHNIETGEIVEREMDNEEYAAYEANELLIAEKEKKISEQIAKKAAAEAKLATLGLTSDDLKALGLN